MIQPLRTLGLLVALPMLYLSGAAAQTGASVSGAVTDPRNGAIPGASVELFARDSHASRRATTGAAGQYRFDAVAPGSYLLQVNAPDFAPYVESVETGAGAGTVANVQLKLAGVRQEVVVTASGTPQTTDEVSKALSVVDDRTIDARDEYAFGEAVRTEAGVRVQRLGGPGAFTTIRIRGLRDRDTAVLIDGLRFRDPSSAQGDATGLIQDLVAADASRIELLRGSGSSLYGTNAIGGVLNLITDEGGGRPRGSLLLEGGSLGLFRGRARVAGGIAKDRLRYSAAFSQWNVVNGVDGDDPARNTSGQAGVTYSPSQAFQVVARVYGARTFAKLNSEPAVIGNPAPGAVVDAIPIALSELRRYEMGVPLSQLAAGRATFLPGPDDPDNSRSGRFLSGALTFSGRLSNSLGYAAGYHGLTSAGTFSDGPAGVGFQPPGSVHTESDGAAHTLNARLDYRPAKWDLIDAGYEFERESLFGRQIDDLRPAAASATRVTQFSNTFFVQDQARLWADRLQLSAAFRAQSFSLRAPRFQPASSAPYTGANFPAPPAAYTGDASAAYFLRGAGTKFRAHAGRGYRAPSLFERFGAGFDPDFGYSVFGDPRLRPERSIGFDAGIDHSFGKGGLRLSSTYFYSRLQDVVIFDFSSAISPSTDLFGRSFGYRNTQGGLARGVELSAQANPRRSLNLSAAYTFVNARERAPILGSILKTFIVPDHQFSFVATQTLGRRWFVNFNLAASSSYLGELFTPVAAAYRFDGIRKAAMGVSYRAPLSEFRAVRVFCKIDNLFNQNYYESGFRTPGIGGNGGLQFEF